MHALLTAVDALTSKTIFAQGESVVSTLNTNQSKAGGRFLIKKNQKENNIKYRASFVSSNPRLADFCEYSEKIIYTHIFEKRFFVEKDCSTNP
jgi:hypothetical protein